MLSVCNYHYIRESFETKYPSIFGVTPVEFKCQLKKLRNTGDFVTIKDLNSDMTKILTSKENFHLVTFDDGLKEQYIYGANIMDELNIEGYFFVNALNFEKKKVSTVHKIHLLRSITSPSKFYKLILSKSKTILTKFELNRAIEIYRFDDELSARLKYLLNFRIDYSLKNSIINDLFRIYFDEESIVSKLYLSNEQLMYLASKSYLGNHSYSHIPLGELNESDLNLEIVHSKKYLEKISKGKINAISYPYGTLESFSENALNVVKKAGHIFGFTTIKGVNNNDIDRLSLNRFDCNDLIGGKNHES